MKIGLALGGGAVYGFAHIGILKVFEKHGLKPNFISGTSVGSLVGGLYASGIPAREIEKIGLGFNWVEIASLTIPKEGLISLEKLENFIEKHIELPNIEDTKIPFYIVATNLLRGTETLFDEGPMAPAIRASCSLPGIFNPTTFGGEIYVDGGILNNVPVNVVKRKGADFVIGIDIMAKSKTDILKHRDIFNIVWKSWQLAIQENTALRSYADADYIMMPDIPNINPFDITKRKEIIAIGERLAESEIKNIRAKIKSRGSLGTKIKKLFKR